MNIAIYWCLFCCVSDNAILGHESSSEMLTSCGNNGDEPQQVKPTSVHLSRSLDIKIIWTLQTWCLPIFIKSCVLYIFSSLQSNKFN